MSLSKWNDIKSKDEKVSSYFFDVQENVKEVDGLLEKINQMGDKQPTFYLLLRGLLHGADISASTSLEKILTKYLNVVETVKKASTGIISSNKRKSRIDSYVELVDETSIYIELKDGGVNHTFDIENKSDDYLERFKASKSDKMIIACYQKDSVKHWSKLTDKIKKDTGKYVKTIQIGTDEWYELFPGFDTNGFIGEYEKLKKNKASDNIEKHRQILKHISEN